MTYLPAEGQWDQVVAVIGWAHTLVHQGGIPRIQTDIRITTRYVILQLFFLSYISF